MKNAYELAENILKSKPDKNIELKSSDSFASIELYGTSACKKVQDTEFCECFHLENESGTGMITLYHVFPGIDLVYNDMHMEYCNKEQKPASSVMEINYCMEGRCECVFEQNEYGYIAAGDLSFCSLRRHLMKQKKLLTLFLTVATSFSMLVACSNATFAESTGTATVTESTNTTDKKQKADENQDAAKQLLVDLTGSYQELWPVILDEKYQQIWIDDCTELVGEENAEAAYDKLASMVSGTIYGEEAVEAYKDGDGVYDCSFKEGVNKLEFNGSDSVIKGYDSEGKEIFSHTYHYVGIEEVRGLYEFKSDDADSGEFTYFCIAPDTNDTTYHIELRYGSDLEALGKYDEGDYAYWLGSGISTDYDQTMVENCIELFCKENLSE